MDIRGRSRTSVDIADGKVRATPPDFSGHSRTFADFRGLQQFANGRERPQADGIRGGHPQTFADVRGRSWTFVDVPTPFNPAN